MNILKDFGKGILYIFAVPLFIVCLAIAMVIGLVIFVFNSIIYIIKFVTGRNMGILTKEDKEGKQIVKEKIRIMQGIPSVTKAEIVEPMPQPAPQYQQPPVSQRIEQAQIHQSHQIEYDEERIISRVEEQPVQEKPQIEVERQPEPKEEPKEEPQEYNPRTSKF